MTSRAAAWLCVAFALASATSTSYAAVGRSPPPRHDPPPRPTLDQPTVERSPPASREPSSGSKTVEGPSEPQRDNADRTTLHDLGYGSPRDTGNALVENVRRFQRDYYLPETGKLDGMTLTELTRARGLREMDEAARSQYAVIAVNAHPNPTGGAFYLVYTHNGKPQLKGSASDVAAFASSIARQGGFQYTYIDGRGLSQNQLKALRTSMRAQSPGLRVSLVDGIDGGLKVATILLASDIAMLGKTSPGTTVSTGPHDGMYVSEGTVTHSQRGKQQNTVLRVYGSSLQWIDRFWRCLTAVFSRTRGLSLASAIHEAREDLRRIYQLDEKALDDVLSAEIQQVQIVQWLQEPPFSSVAYGWLR